MSKTGKNSNLLQLSTEWWNYSISLQWNAVERIEVLVHTTVSTYNIEDDSKIFYDDNSPDYKVSFLWHFGKNKSFGIENRSVVGRGKGYK